METVQGAKEYLFGLTTSLKLTEKQHEEKLAEKERWQKRVDLAKSHGEDNLALEAANEVNRIEAKLVTLETEIQELKAEIEKLKNDLPHIKASERSVDPDLLQQELLIQAGRLPGDGASDNAFASLEKDAEAEAALAALKAKIAGAGSEKETV